jgi:hypothetical protein
MRLIEYMREMLTRALSVFPLSISIYTMLLFNFEGTIWATCKPCMYFISFGGI